MPIARLRSTSYQHPAYGKTYKPVFEIVGWTRIDEEPTGSPSTPPPPAAAGRRAYPPPSRGGVTEMFAPEELVWFDFETSSAVDLKTAGGVRYSVDETTKAIVLAFAIGDEPAEVWHAAGTILDWNDAPEALGPASNPE